MADGQVADRMDHRKAGAHGALGIVLLGTRVAEVSEYAVAHIFGHVPFVQLDGLGADLMKRVDYVTEVFNIELGREGSRADKVTEY